MKKKPAKSPIELAVIDLVRQKRLEKGLSQDDLALILGADRSFIGQVESPTNPSKYNLNHINQISKEWGCSPKDFLPQTPI